MVENHKAEDRQQGLEDQTLNINTNCFHPSCLKQYGSSRHAHPELQSWVSARHKIYFISNKNNIIHNSEVWGQ